MNTSKKQSKTLIILGNSNTGKSSINLMLAKSKYSEAYVETIGANYFNKTLKFEKTDYQLNIWDTSGSEKEIRIVPASFYKKADGFFIICSYDNENSMLNIKQWIEFIYKNVGNNITKESSTSSSLPIDKQIVVLLNKADLKSKVKIGKSKSVMIKTCESFDIPYFEVTSKDQFIIEDAFLKMLDFMIVNKRAHFRRSTNFTGKQTTTDSTSVFKLQDDDEFKDDEESKQFQNETKSIKSRRSSSVASKKRKKGESKCC